MHRVPRIFPTSLLREHITIAVWLFDDGKLVGETYGIPLDGEEEIPEGCPKDPHSIYCYSTTILGKYKGRGYGKILKAVFIGRISRDFRRIYEHPLIHNECSLLWARRIPNAVRESLFLDFFVIVRFCPESSLHFDKTNNGNYKLNKEKIFFHCDSFSFLFLNSLKSAGEIP